MLWRWKYAVLQTFDTCWCIPRFSSNITPRFRTFEVDFIWASPTVISGMLTFCSCCLLPFILSINQLKPLTPTGISQTPCNNKFCRLLNATVVAFVSLSKTLNHNCFVLRMGRKAVGPVCCVMHVKEPRTLIVKEKGLAPVFLDSCLNNNNNMWTYIAHVSTN